jgi:2-polyprenyl-3-methyl-5-hydroxy-6-metoxy-1,4-benzoquinol methylase
MKKLDIYLQNVRIDKAVQFIKPGNKILDIGSGDGPLFKFLEKTKIPFTGIGLDPEVVETRTINYNIFPDKFPNEKISGNRFDIITALAVLEHIPKDALSEFAMNCNRHLEMGGQLVITVPSKQVDQILKLLIGLKIIDGMEVDQHYGYDTGQTIPLFRESGFELVSYRKFQLGLNNLFVFVKKSEA